MCLYVFTCILISNNMIIFVLFESRIVLAENRLAVVANMWYHSAGANPFLDWRVMAEWLRRWLQQWLARVSLRLWGPRFATGIQLMKQFVHNWYLHCCQCMEPCYHVAFISGPEENRSCPESTRQCVIPLSWCQFVFRRMGHGRVVKTLALRLYCALEAYQQTVWV